MLLVAVAAALAAPARADTPPSKWERAKDPTAYEDWRLHVSAERVLLDMQDARRLRPDLFDRFARDLRTSLESWGAADSKDVRLRLDYGRALVEHFEYRAAVPVLRQALEMAKDYPAADQGWWQLGIACGHLGDNACEEKAYREVLRIRTEDDERLVPMLNLAETEMHLGRLKEAIADYEETLRMAARLPTDMTTTLARWGLAVAFDRSGDRPAAEREAGRALELAKSMHHEMLLHQPGVFFYPDYEVAWYDGLAAIARARAAPNAHAAAIAWAEAERKFAAYVHGAENRRDGGTDRWLPMAKARVAICKTEHEKAEKRSLKEPVQRSDDEELPL